MKIEEYQKFTNTTNCYPSSLMFECLSLGLCSETGEIAEKMIDVNVNPKCLMLDTLSMGMCAKAGNVAGKLKKLKRDNTDKMKFYQDIVKELGDVMWYISELSNAIGIDMEEIMRINKEKLEQRMQKNTISGSGDNR